jgi:hypothetical protein
MLVDEQWSGVVIDDVLVSIGEMYDCNLIDSRCTCSLAVEYKVYMACN